MGSPLSFYLGMESEDFWGYGKSNYWGDGVKLLGGCIPPSPLCFGSRDQATCRIESINIQAEITVQDLGLLAGDLRLTHSCNLRLYL